MKLTILDINKLIPNGPIKRVVYSVLFGMLMVLTDMLLVLIIGLNDSGELFIGLPIAFIAFILHLIISIPAVFFVGNALLAYISIFVFWSVFTFFLLKKKKQDL